MQFAIQQRSDWQPVASSLVDRLMSAHGRIESAFLEGGQTLVSVMDVVNGMITILDSFGTSLDGDVAQGMVAGMSRAIDDLASLPETVSTRQRAFEAIAETCQAAVAQVQSMHETFRYLKVFATTVKITGAGLSEFSEFADEIQARIRSGADEISRFSVELASMKTELDQACLVAKGIAGDLGSSVPDLAGSLSRSAVRLKEENKATAVLAKQVKAIATEVQAKIGRTLSALQVGDITRQRIEHITSSLELLSEFLSSSEGHNLAEDDRANLENAVFGLVHAQLEDMLTDFREKCGRIHSTIASFSVDASQILALRSELARSDEDAGNSSLAIMARDIGSAIKLTTTVEVRSTQSAALARSVAHSVGALISSIECIRAIKTDIHYMALNSNLRCSRLGDAGRSVNVVSAELRVFAGGLEGPADAVVAIMRQISDVSERLTQSSEPESVPLHLPLEHALDVVSSAAAEFQRGAQALDDAGQAVFGRISSAVRALDFEQRLGDVIADCTRLAAGMAAKGPPSPCGSFADDLSNRIYALYTMVEEREIHRLFLPLPASQPVIAQDTRQDDDTFLEDALF